MSSSNLAGPNKHIIRSLMLVFRLIPFPFIYRVGEVEGVLAYHLIKRRHNIGISNLRIAFPDKSDKELERILLSCWQNIGKDVLETVKYCALSTEQKRKQIVIKGKEYLELAMSKQKGVIALSAHFGCFPVLCQRLAAEGYPVATIYRKMHNKLLAPLVPTLQREGGIEPIQDLPRHRCVASSLRWLKSGGILFLQIDQNPSRKAGVPIDFFGKKVPTFRGPVTFAMRTGAEILPMFILRGKDNRHQIVIHKPYELKLTGNNKEDIPLNLENLSKITEEYIRRYPEHWWWIHRRFRKAL